MEFAGLVHGRDAESPRIGGNERPRHGHRAEAVGIGLDHGEEGHSHPGAVSSGIADEGVEVHIDPRAGCIGSEWCSHARETMTGEDTMQADSPLDRAVAMVADLRERCPWDNVQTRETLRPYLIEEAHELAAALGTGDPVAIREEVADLMLHLAWQLVLGEEARRSSPPPTSRTTSSPRCSGATRTSSTSVRGAAGSTSRPGNGGSAAVRSTGLPASLPELLAAFRLQERAAGVGFDWPDTAGPIAKVKEELAEVDRRARRRPMPVGRNVSPPRSATCSSPS